MDQTVKDSAEDPEFIGPWIRKEELSKSNIYLGIGTKYVCLTTEEWKKLQDEEEKAENIRKYLSGIEKEYVKINESTADRGTY
ncbi:hypothetical protein RCL_jg25055.t1 [Rhizophagus clarus]|uniref:Uncharacterized protein n=1 Tax=Rhizophagus clarus TaxID=94130 RepID=A0A8H3QT02_9GLOM|nr:hypothetical protein RCL_jg25055.t1 [Rhizophagus clarus]